MKSFSLIQLYFVLATLVGLILIIIASVSLVKMGLDSVLGVQQYPQFSAPYPPTRDIVNPDDPAATESQREALSEWEANYSSWKENDSKYNAAEQNIKRDTAQSLAMLIVGLPVFLIHMPKVFGKAKD